MHVYREKYHDWSESRIKDIPSEKYMYNINNKEPDRYGYLLPTWALSYLKATAEKGPKGF